MSPAEGRRQRAALMRDIAREIKAKNRAKLLSLRSRVRATRAEARASLRQAIAQCRARRKLPTLAQVAAELREAKRAARSQCDVDLKAARALRDATARSRAELAAEQKYQRDLRRIEADNRRKAIAERRSRRPTRGASAGESDEEVEGNLPPELVALWRRVRRQIKGSDRKSRTEAFLQYAEEHPAEEWAALEDSVDRAIAEMERRQAMPNPKKKKRARAKARKKNKSKAHVSPALTRARADARRWRHKAEKLQHAAQRREHKKIKNPRRPPGRWFDRCLASVTAQRYARDPAAVCGAQWWRMPAHERAAIVRRWERGGPKQKRLAVAVAKAERNRAMRGHRKKKTRR